MFILRAAQSETNAESCHRCTVRGGEWLNSHSLIQYLYTVLISLCNQSSFVCEQTALSLYVSVESLNILSSRSLWLFRTTTKPGTSFTDLNLT